ATADAFAGIPNRPANDTVLGTDPTHGPSAGSRESKARTGVTPENPPAGMAGAVTEPASGAPPPASSTAADPPGSDDAVDGAGSGAPSASAAAAVATVVDAHSNPPVTTTTRIADTATVAHQDRAPRIGIL